MKNNNSWIPFWNKPPCQFIRYEESRFQYNHGSGTLREVVYLNKKKQTCRCDAQVIWDEQPYSKEWCNKYLDKDGRLKYNDHNEENINDITN